jgi:2-methylisocitrate lyase-like PEP mutase family enzyme
LIVVIGVQAIQELEIAGRVGINLEGEVFPKRGGLSEGKKIIPMKEMVKKLRSED